MMRTSVPLTERREGHALRAGFSLLEILVCLLLLGILSAGFARIFQGALALGQLQEKEKTEIRTRRQAVRQQFAGMEEAEAVIQIQASD